MDESLKQAESWVDERRQEDRRQRIYWMERDMCHIFFPSPSHLLHKSSTSLPRFIPHTYTPLTLNLVSRFQIYDAMKRKSCRKLCDTRINSSAVGKHLFIDYQRSFLSVSLWTQHFSTRPRVSYLIRRLVLHCVIYLPNSNLLSTQTSTRHYTHCQRSLPDSSCMCYIGRGTLKEDVTGLYREYRTKDATDNSVSTRMEYSGEILRYIRAPSWENIFFCVCCEASSCESLAHSQSPACFHLQPLPARTNHPGEKWQGKEGNTLSREVLLESFCRCRWANDFVSQHPNSPFNLVSTSLYFLYSNIPFFTIRKSLGTTFLLSSSMALSPSHSPRRKMAKTITKGAKKCFWHYSDLERFPSTSSASLNLPLISSFSVFCAIQPYQDFTHNARCLTIPPPLTRHVSINVLPLSLFWSSILPCLLISYNVYGQQPPLSMNLEPSSQSMTTTYSKAEDSTATMITATEVYCVYWILNTEQ